MKRTHNHSGNSVPENIGIKGSSVRSTDMFFGREKEMSDISDMIVNANRNVILITGGDKIGKTSLLRQIMNGILSNIGCPVLCEFKHISAGVNMTHDISYHIGSAIVSCEKFREFYDLFHNGTSPWSDKLHLLITKCLDNIKPGKLLLLCDDYHYLNEVLATGNMLPSSLNWAENLMDLPIIFILCGNQSIKNCLGGCFSTDYAEKEIGLLSEKKTWDVINKLTQGIIQFKNPTAILTIYRLSGGHPFYLHHILQELIEYVKTFKQPPQINDNIIETIIDRIIEYSSEQIKTTWNRLGWRERVTLTVLANSLRDARNYTNIVGIMNTVKRGGFSLTPAEYQESLHALEETFLIDQKDGGHQARFQIDIFRQWIARYYKTCEDLDRRKVLRNDKKDTKSIMFRKWLPIAAGLIFVLSAAIYSFISTNKFYESSVQTLPSTADASAMNKASDSAVKADSITPQPRQLAAAAEPTASTAFDGSGVLIGQTVRIRQNIQQPCEGWGNLKPDENMVVIETGYLGKYLKIGASTDKWGIVCPEDIEIVR